MPANTIYVGRPTFWGNRFSPELFSWMSSTERVRQYRFWLYGFGSVQLAEMLCELRGKNLCCWCPLDKPCHADLLLQLANRRRKQP